MLNVLFIKTTELFSRNIPLIRLWKQFWYFFAHRKSAQKPTDAPIHVNSEISYVLELVEYQLFVICYVFGTKNLAHKRLRMTAQEAAFHIMKHAYSRSHSQPFASPNANQCPFMLIFLSFIPYFPALPLPFPRIFPSARKYHIILFLSHHDIILAKRPCTFP